VSGDAAYAGSDAVVRVPRPKARQQAQGFSQAEMLSKRLAKSLKPPYLGVLLVRKAASAESAFVNGA